MNTELDGEIGEPENDTDIEDKLGGVTEVVELLLELVGT